MGRQAYIVCPLVEDSEALEEVKIPPQRNIMH